LSQNLITALVECGCRDELFAGPSERVLVRAVECARRSDDPVARARLLTLLAPHKVELWPEAIRAIADVREESSRSVCLQQSLEHLPPAYFNSVIEIVEQLREMKLKAEMLADIATFGPTSVIPRVLNTVGELPRLRRACALAKVAFYAPSASFAEILRLAPWFESDEINAARDRLKAYLAVLPQRLTRNFLVLLLQHLYQEWTSIDGRSPAELYGPTPKVDPSGPSQSYWNFQKTDWNIALECSAFTTKTPRKDEWFVLSIWTHGPRARLRVRDLAKELNRAALAGRTTGLSAAKESQVTISFQPRDLVVRGDSNHPVSSIDRSFFWAGRPVNVDIVAKCPAEYDGGRVVETVSVLVEGLKVAELVVEIDFELANPEASSRFKRVESAFASYARKDIVEVIARLQAIEKMAPGIRLFWDVESLRAGDRWEERLREEIVNRDLLYLFWSENAAQSRWVDWEWHCAFQHRGIEYIDPLPLDGTAPPQELASLQFADRWVRHLRYEQLHKAAFRTTES
jgi:TIR domain